MNATLPRAPRKSKSVPFSAALEARINGTRYALARIDAGPDGTAAYRLEKAGDAGGVYDVIRTHAGLVECSCPDYEARHRGVDGGCCKHGKAMVQLGLMAAPAIVELPRAEEAPAPSPSPSPSAEARRIARAQAAAFGIKVPAAAVEAPAVVAEQAPAIVEPSEAARVERAPAGFATELVAAVGPIEPPADAQVEAPAPCCPADEAEPCMPCRSAEVAAVQADPKPEPDGPGLFTLDEHIDAEADRLAGYGTDAGHLMARTLRELARTVRFVEARTPGDFADRAAALAAR